MAPLNPLKAQDRKPKLRTVPMNPPKTRASQEVLGFQRKMAKRRLPHLA